jgi:hypothetical protein
MLVEDDSKFFKDKPEWGKGKTINPGVMFAMSTGEKLLSK